MHIPLSQTTFESNHSFNESFEPTGKLFESKHFIEDLLEVSEEDIGIVLQK